MKNITLKILLLVESLLMTLFEVNAQSIIRIDSNFKYQQLDEFATYIENPNFKFTIGEIEKLELKKYNPEVLNFGGQTPPMWFKFQIENIYLDDEFILDVSSVGLNYAEVYVLDKSQKIIKLPKSSRRQTLSMRPVPNNKLLFKIYLKAQQRYTLYIKTSSKHEQHRISFFLYDQKEFIKRDFIQQNTFFISVGCLLLAVLVSLILFAFIKQKIYWQYSLYIFSLFTVITVVSGYIDPYLLQIPYLKYDNTYSLIVFLCIAVHLMFTNSYLHVKQFAPKWLVIIGKFIIWTALFSTIVYFLPIKLVHSNLPKFNHQLLVIAEIYILFNIIIGMKNKHLPSVIYFIRFIPYILGAFAYIFNILLFDYIYQVVDSLLIASIFEMLFLAFGLSLSYFDTLNKQKSLLHELSQAQLNILHAQETERQRIAQDLHDEVGNSLAALKNYISQTNLELGEKINKIAQDVRNISHNLASIDFEKMTLSVAFQNLINRHNEAESIDYELIEVGKPQKLSAERELVIYRIVCELLNNIQKHAKAQKATLQLVYEAQNLTIIVEDDGIGIKNKPTIEEGIGLKHIQTRVVYLNAKLTIEDDGKGTIIVIDVPIST